MSASTRPNIVVEMFASLVGKGKPKKPSGRMKSSVDPEIERLRDTVKKVNALNLFIASRLNKAKIEIARLEKVNSQLKAELVVMTEDTPEEPDIPIKEEAEEDDWTKDEQ